MKNRIISAMKVSKGIVLGAHINPDGDAMGALVGMATLCGFLHIPYQVMLEKTPENFKELLEHIEVNNTVTIDYDTFISVDCGDVDRLGKYKVSFRSNAPYDVAKIATTFGGGGHARAAGATLNGTLEQVIGHVYSALNSES